jgi:hypothetical protein
MDPQSQRPPVCLVRGRAQAVITVGCVSIDRLLLLTGELLWWANDFQLLFSSRCGTYNVDRTPRTDRTESCALTCPRCK